MGSGDRRRNWLIAAALVFGALAALLAASKSFKFGVADIVAGFCLSIVTLIIGTLNYRADRLDLVGGAASKERERRVARLAAIVNSELTDERAAQLRDKRALPVRWVPAAPELVARWSAVVDLASNGKG